MMTERELERRVNALNRKINEARAKCNLGTVVRLTAEMNALRQQFIREERMTMNKAIEEMPVNVKYDLSRRIQHISILVDMLDFVITDFKGALANVDPYLKAVFTEGILEHGKAMSKFIAKYIDGHNNMELSDDFADLSDRCRMIVMNEIYKHEAIIRNKEKNNKQLQ